MRQAQTRSVQGVTIFSVHHIPLKARRASYEKDREVCRIPGISEIGIGRLLGPARLLPCTLLAGTSQHAAGLWDYRGRNAVGGGQLLHRCAISAPPDFRGWWRGRAHSNGPSRDSSVFSSHGRMS